MRNSGTHIHLDDLASPPSNLWRFPGGSHRTRRCSRGLLRGYLIVCAGALFLGLVARPVLRWLYPAPRAQARRQVAESAHLLGPVLSERERLKLSFIAQTVEEKFPALEPDERSELVEALYVSGQRHGVDPLLALAVIAQESNYERAAESSVGALGLMQVRPFVAQAVARDLGLEWQGRPTLTNPAQNVRIGIAYLAKMKKRYQRNALALAAYNLGPYRLRELMTRGAPAPTSYSERVLGFYQGYQREYLLALSEAGTAGPKGDGTLAMAEPMKTPDGIPQ